MTKKLSKSVRKHIRIQKARIREEILDVKKQKELIAELINKFHGNKVSKDKS